MEKLTIENSKLIAEFMGLEFDETHYRSPIKMKHGKGVFYHMCLHNDLRYHESWDWLMPVVDKARKLIMKEKVIVLDMGDDEMIEGLLKVDILQVHIGVIKFINWYNN